MSEKLIRAAIRLPSGNTRAVYGTPVMDGGLIDQNGARHEPGTWFRSRQADGSEDENDFPSAAQRDDLGLFD